MIRYTRGNLLEAPSEALVNTVNTVGVMGKGIALAFKESFPTNYSDYEAASKRGEIAVGRMFVTENRSLHGPKWIINFPTKKHWRQPSKLEWIDAGLQDLANVVRERHIRSIAVPPLGCGNGKLNWNDVRDLIASRLAVLEDVEVTVFEPTDKYQTDRKAEGETRLTPARALIAEAVRRYAILGIESSYLEVQKLAYFLERIIRALSLPDVLRLKFTSDKYGPYSDPLRHLLNTLDGSFLHSERRLADAGPTTSIRFEDSRRDEVERYLRQQAREFLPALSRMTELIDGFESPLGMELLATVDWILAELGAPPTLDGVREALSRWPGGSKSAARKARLFDDRLLEMALERLTEVGAKGNTSDGWSFVQ